MNRTPTSRLPLALAIAFVSGSSGRNQVFVAPLPGYPVVLASGVLFGTIPGAKHVPRGMLEFWADPASPYYRDYFQEHRRTVVFCAGGGRSVFATLALKDMGFKDVAHLEPGFNGWQKAGGTVEDVAATSRWVRREKSQ